MEGNGAVIYYLTPSGSGYCEGLITAVGECQITRSSNGKLFNNRNLFNPEGVAFLWPSYAAFSEPGMGDMIELEAVVAGGC